VILRVVAGITGGAEPPDAGGLIRAHLGADRATGELVEVTVWGDPEAARPAAGDSGRAAYFDIGSTWLEWSRDEPAAFRLAVARFTRPGADLEMVTALRDRMPLVGDDVTESAVGRRLVDRAVEIVFFSAWAREPSGWRLDRALWPDISVRCDEFGVRVCDPTRPILSRQPVP
jgi:hypothetical protein